MLVVVDGEELATQVRTAFERGRPEVLLEELRAFVDAKDAQIEELCKVHYEEFIRSVDDLVGVKDTTKELRADILDHADRVQHYGGALLSKQEELLSVHQARMNLAAAARHVSHCSTLLDAFARVQSLIGQGALYPALHTLAAIERAPPAPARVLSLLVRTQVPAARRHIENIVTREFNEWMVHARAVAGEVGRKALGQSAAQRKKQAGGGAAAGPSSATAGATLAAKASSSAGPTSADVVYELLPAQEVLGSEHPVDKKDLLSLHKCLYIFKCLGKLSDFQESYVTNRRLQLSSVLQPGGPPFLDSYKPFLAQVVGFFLVEDKTLRTADDLVTSSHVDALWEVASDKIQSLVWAQFDRQPLARGATPDASHNIAPLAALNEFMQLVLSTLGRYGLKMSDLEATMVRCMRRYQVLLTANAEEKVRNAIKADRYQQVLIGSPVMHQNLVVAYALYPREHKGPPPLSTIPYYAAFSHVVPELISLLKNYIEDCFSALETSHGSTQPFPLLTTAAATDADKSVRSATTSAATAGSNVGASNSAASSNANTPMGGNTPGGSMAGGVGAEEDGVAGVDDSLLSPRSGGLSLHSALKECLDAILRGPIAETFRTALFSPSLAVPQAMQVVSNIGSLLQACDALARHVALCCGMPVATPPLTAEDDNPDKSLRGTEDSSIRRMATFTAASLVRSPSAGVNPWELRSWDVLAREVRLNDELAKEMRAWEVLARLQEEGKAVVLRLTEEKLRSFLVLPEEWTPEVAPSGPSDYLSDLVAYLRTVLETSLRLLPAVTVHTLHVMALQLVADALLEKLCSDAVKGFNMRAIEGLDLDVTVLEAFADDRTAVAINARTTPVPVGGKGMNMTGVSNELAKLFKESLPLKECMSGPRHLINFFKRACVEEDETLLAGNVKEKFFPHMKKAQVATILDKYRKAPSAGLFGMKNKKRDPRKSTVYACARLLRASP